jgi:excinuclease UvrABC nuclease subunit
MTREDEKQIFRIKWIGRKRFQALVAHYGSVEELRQASVESLASVPYMRKDIALKVKDALK